MAGQPKGIGPAWTQETESKIVCKCLKALRSMPTTSARTRSVAISSCAATPKTKFLKKANEHAKTAHNMHNMTPDVLSKVRAAIHDEGQATKKAGA